MYNKNLNFHFNLRMSDVEYEYVHHVAIITGKPVNVVIREIIDKEILKNGYKKTSSMHNLEYDGIFENEIK